MDLVMIILTVFLGGIVLVLATLWAWFGPSVNSVQSFFRKVVPTHPLEEEQTIPRAPQRPITADSDSSGREQVSCRSVDVVYTCPWYAATYVERTNADGVYEWTVSTPGRGMLKGNRTALHTQCLGSSHNAVHSSSIALYWSIHL